MNSVHSKPSMRLRLGMTLGVLALSLSSVMMRNREFEFCTTRTFGFPLPWYHEWCECKHGAFPVSLTNCVVNIVCCVVLGFMLAKGVHWVQKKRKAYDPSAA